MRLGNSENHYGAVSAAFHWLMALMLMALIVIGLYMTSLPDVGFNTLKIRLILCHKELGMVALALVGLRLLWRLGNLLPQLVASVPDWQKVIARLVQLCFYALMFALPLTGWLMSSAAAIPVSALGWFTLPDLVGPDESLFHTLIDVHKWLGYLLLALLVAHASAALRHHFILRDDTLRRMLPDRDS